MSERIEQFFSDGISAISVTGGVVRLDFVVLSPTEKDSGGNPKMEITHRAVMPLDALVRATAKLQETVQALVERGFVRQPPTVASPSLVERTAAPDTVSQPSEPVPPRPKGVPFP